MPHKPLDDSGTNYAGSYASALYIDASGTTEKKIEETVNQFKKSDLYTKSLWEITHYVWANNYHLSYENHRLTINDETVSIEYEPKPYDENFDYKRNILKRVTVSIQNQSKELIVLVAVVIVIFTVMIIYARKMTRRLLLDEKIKRKGRK